MTLKEEVQSIQNLALKYSLLKISEPDLISEINSLETGELELITDLYKGASIKQPVNHLRARIVSHLTQRKTLTKEWLADQIDEIESELGRSSFKAYSSFSILFPFLRELNGELKVKSILTKIGNSVIQSLKIKEVVKKPHVVDFRGPRSFGSDRVWMAIYNRTHPNQTTAKQLFLIIDSSGLSISFYNRYEDKHEERLKIELDDEILKNITAFFSGFKGLIEKNTYESLKPRQLGVNGCRVFKLSFGKDYFDKEAVQFCITNNLAVVHEDTKRKARLSFSQFELFESAKVGDIFYATWSNNQFLFIGQFVDEATDEFGFYHGEPGWKQRRFKLLYTTLDDRSYSGNQHWWTPSDNSTFVEINAKDFDEANKNLFTPYFKVELDHKKNVQLPIISRGIGAGMELYHHDSDVDPKLNVNIVGTEFARLI